MKKRLLIAIDGPSASGKGTVARFLSKTFNIPHLDTGGLYRATARKCIENNIDLNNEQLVYNISKTLSNDDIINPMNFTEDMGGKASIVAEMQCVRDSLFQFQRNFANQEGGAVLDGRDIGTVICPDADYKFFIIASAEERANRRYKEMLEKGKEANFKDILQKIKERDERDMNREASPFKKADDAILIDTTNMSIQQVFDYVLSFIK
ncbi:MAG TPA: (d)CMP kinase [Rickettsiales bacterium]|nr:(d)CMP kinase [Rickettsiales bacterium]